MDLGGPDLRIRLSGVIISILNLVPYSSFPNVLGHKVNHSEQTSQIFCLYHLEQSTEFCETQEPSPETLSFSSLKTSFLCVMLTDNLAIFLSSAHSPFFSALVFACKSKNLSYLLNLKHLLDYRLFSLRIKKVLFVWLCC